jgi:hypothetical protein
MYGGRSTLQVAKLYQKVHDLRSYPYVAHVLFEPVSINSITVSKFQSFIVIKGCPIFYIPRRYNTTTRKCLSFHTSNVMAYPKINKLWNNEAWNKTLRLLIYSWLIHKCFLTTGFSTLGSKRTGVCTVPQQKLKYGYRYYKVTNTVCEYNKNHFKHEFCVLGTIYFVAI